MFAKKFQTFLSESISARGPFVDLLTDSTQVTVTHKQLFSTIYFTKIILFFSQKPVTYYTVENHIVSIFKQQSV